MKLKLQTANPETHKRLSAAYRALVPTDNKGGTFRFAHSSEGSPTEIKHVVTTGIRAFDDRVGGMPFGKASELLGLPQSGKTTMAIRTAVRAQQGFIYERNQTPDGRITTTKLKPGTFEVTVLYFDQEGSLSDFDKRVVDGAALDAEIVQPDTVELLWHITDKTMDVLSDVEQTSGKLQFLIVVVDTVGTLATKSDYLAAWGKQDYPRVPGELKAGFKVMIGRMQRENVMLIGLNHVSKRMEIRGKTAHKAWEYNAPGGKAFSYYAFHRVFFEMQETRYSLTGKGAQDGFLIYFSALKNRLAPPLRPGRLALLFTIKDPETGDLLREGGFYDNFSILESLIYAKVATVSKETGAISFDFDDYGIPTTTFEPQADIPSLEEQEEEEEVEPKPKRRGRRIVSQEPDDSANPEEAVAPKPLRKKRKPKIPNRAAWPEFYEAHKADIELLYAEVSRRATMASDLVAAGVSATDITEVEGDGED